MIGAPEFKFYLMNAHGLSNRGPSLADRVPDCRPPPGGAWPPQAAEPTSKPRAITQGDDAARGLIATGGLPGFEINLSYGNQFGPLDRYLTVGYGLPRSLWM